MQIFFTFTKISTSFEANTLILSDKQDKQVLFIFNSLRYTTLQPYLPKINKINKNQLTSLAGVFVCVCIISCTTI